MTAPYSAVTSSTLDTSTRYRVGLVTLLSLNYGIVFFDRNALSFLMPFIQPDLNLSGTQIGLLTSALSLTWSLAAFMLSRFSDRTGNRKGVLVASTIVFSLCSVFTGLAPSFLVLLLARMVMGISEGGVLPISMAMIAGTVSDKHRALAMGITQNLGSSLLGSLIAPLALVAIATQFGWRHAFVLAGAPGLILAFLIWKIARPDVSAPVAERPTRMPVRELLAERNIALCGAIAILFVSFVLVGLTFLPLYLVQERGFTPSTMSLLMAVLGMSCTVNSVFVSALADRLGRKPLMIVGALLGLLAPLGALYYDGGMIGLVILLWLGWTPVGLFPLFMGAIPSESTQPAMAATAIGFTMALGESIGGVFSPVIAGVVADGLGLSASIWILAILCLGVATLSLFLRETAPRFVAMQTLRERRAV